MIASCWLSISAAGQLGATFDEPLYIARGLDFWRTGSHAGLMRLGTMPLPADLATLPLYLYERWSGVSLHLPADLPQILTAARSVTLVFWTLLLVYCWRAGWLIAGRWAGILAAALVAFEPTILAHASFATTDIAVSACLLAMACHFKTADSSPTLRRAGLTAPWFAAAVLSKASALLFGPLILVAIEAQRSRHFFNQSKKFWHDLALMVGLGMVLVFLYCGCDWGSEPSFVKWAQALPPGPFGGCMKWLSAHLNIFTNAGDGLVRQIRHNVRGHGPVAAYLLGSTARAFWYYFPLALTIKLTIPLLLLPVVLAFISPGALGNWANAVALVLLLMSPIYRVQIGIRMVLPLIVFAAVGLGASLVAAYRKIDSGWQRPAIAAAALFTVAANAFTAISIRPNAICYGNALWGGTGREFKLLSDSNCDWGQGLPELSRWQRIHSEAPLDVWYFGTDPAMNALNARSLRIEQMAIERPADLSAIVKGRYLAASKTLVYGAPESKAHSTAAAYLREQRPFDQTSTFLIYDITKSQ
jgi:hypothetical protein